MWHGQLKRNNQMVRKYSVKSKSCRWPFQVFFNILDLAGINACVLYKAATGEKMSRQEFLFQLAKEENVPKISTNTSSDSHVRKCT